VAKGETPKVTTVSAKATHPAGPAIIVPKGTQLTAVVDQTLHSAKTHEGDTFAASLAAPVQIDGKTVLPKGAHVTGKVVMAMDTDQETLDWIQKGSIAATIAQKPFTMAFVGLQMLDNLYHHKPSTLDKDWSKDSFAPIPSFVDTGSGLIDKSNVAAFMEAGKSLTSAPK
jgi:hypothetical protein